MLNLCRTLFLPVFLLSIIFSSLGLVSQTRASKAQSVQKLSPEKSQAAKKLSPEKKFVLEVVQMAVALPQPEQQDRLRVLNSAISVVKPLAPQYASKLAKEGAEIEAQLISAGETPAASVLSDGEVDCDSAVDFVQRIYPKSVLAAEQSLIGALTNCKDKTEALVRQRADSALEQGILAPRLLMALMDAEGPSSQWSQDRFHQMFSSLPDPKDTENAKEAPNYAAMYSSMAPQVDKDVATSSGLSLLEWLGKVDAGGERTLALHITTDAMQKALGAEGYQRALASNIMARQAAESAGDEPGEIERQEEESVSVLGAMDQVGTDQSESLKDLPPSLRARQAAAYGFASGTSGDKKAASSYFDVAFAALNDVWKDRAPDTNVAAVVEEVSEAAANVDPVQALTRAQKLDDSSAQAISMLAVARVVASSGMQ